MSTRQEKQSYAKQQSLVKKNHMNVSLLASLENNQSFYSIAEFFVCLKTLSERKVSSDFVASN